MENKIKKYTFPLDIMMKANEEKGLRLSTLVSDSQLLSKYDNLTNLFSNIYKLIALRLINIQREYDYEEGEDYIFRLNRMGSSILESQK